MLSFLGLPHDPMTPASGRGPLFAAGAVGNVTFGKVEEVEEFAASITPVGAAFRSLKSDI